MSIEATNAKATYSFRINPYAPTEIDRRRNQHRAFWQFYERCETAEQARLEVIRLAKEDTDHAANS